MTFSKTGIKAEKRRQAQKQANYDRILLATFSSEKDLLRARNNQLEAIEGLMKLTQGKLRTLQRKLRKYQDQAAHLERNGHPVFPKLLDNIQTIKNRLTNNQRYIEKKRQKKAAIREKFAQDLKRFCKLKQRVANSSAPGK